MPPRGLAFGILSDVDDIEELIPTGAVDVGVFGAEVVEIAVSRFATVQAVTVAPEMFSVPAGCQAETGSRFR